MEITKKYQQTHNMCGADVQNALDLIKDAQIQFKSHTPSNLCSLYINAKLFCLPHSVSNPSITKTCSPEHLCSVMGSYPRVITELERFSHYHEPC